MYLVALICLFVLGNVTCQNNGTDVINYSENFLDEVKNQTVTLVRFGTTWCGYCKAMEDDLQKAGALLKKSGSVGSMGKVDCTKPPIQQLCGKLLINGYPTIKLYKKGEFKQDYYGPRTAESMVYFLQQQALKP
jgi:protein disulfide isomerase family A protein 3